MRRFNFNEFWAFWLILTFLAVITLFAPKADAEDRVSIPIQKGKPACTYVVGFDTLSVYYERILVVAEKPMLDEDGNPDPEWWVVNLQNPDRNQRDEKGHLLAYNIPKDQVLFASPADGPVMVMHHMRVCKCPPQFWGTSTTSAEH